MSEGVRVRESERVSEGVSEQVSQSEPESELEGLKVGFRVTLGQNLWCQSQPRQCDLENNNFPYIVDQFMLEETISRMCFWG